MKKKNLTAIILIVLGVLFIIFKLDLIKYLISSFGLLFIIFGIIDLINKRENIAIGEIIIGVLLIALSWLLLDICLLMIGITILVYAVRKLSFALKLTKHVDSIYKKIELVAFPLISTILGVLLIIGRWELGNTLCIIIGIIIILNGISLIINKDYNN